MSKAQVFTKSAKTFNFGISNIVRDEETDEFDQPTQSNNNDNDNDDNDGDDDGDDDGDGDGDEKHDPTEVESADDSTSDEED